MGSRAHLDVVVKRTNPSPGRPARSIYTILTELLRLRDFETAAKPEIWGPSVQTFSYICVCTYRKAAYVVNVQTNAQDVLLFCLAERE